MFYCCWVKACLNGNYILLVDGGEFISVFTDILLAGSVCLFLIEGFCFIYFVILILGAYELLYLLDELTLLLLREVHLFL